MKRYVLMRTNDGWNYDRHFYHVLANSEDEAGRKLMKRFSHGFYQPYLFKEKSELIGKWYASGGRSGNLYNLTDKL